MSTAAAAQPQPQPPQQPPPAPPQSPLPSPSSFSSQTLRPPFTTGAPSFALPGQPTAPGLAPTAATTGPGAFGSGATNLSGAFKSSLFPGAVPGAPRPASVPFTLPNLQPTAAAPAAGTPTAATLAAAGPTPFPFPSSAKPAAFGLPGSTFSGFGAPAGTAPNPLSTPAPTSAAAAAATSAPFGGAVATPAINLPGIGVSSASLGGSFSFTFNNKNGPSSMIDKLAAEASVASGLASSPVAGITKLVRGAGLNLEVPSADGGGLLNQALASAAATPSADIFTKLVSNAQQQKVAVAKKAENEAQDQEALQRYMQGPTRSPMSLLRSDRGQQLTAAEQREQRRAEQRRMEAHFAEEKRVKEAAAAEEAARELQARLDAMTEEEREEWEEEQHIKRAAEARVRNERRKRLIHLYQAFADEYGEDLDVNAEWLLDHCMDNPDAPRPPEDNESTEMLKKYLIRRNRQLEEAAQREEAGEYEADHSSPVPESLHKEGDLPLYLTDLESRIKRMQTYLERQHHEREIAYKMELAHATQMMALQARRAEIEIDQRYRHELGPHDQHVALVQAKHEKELKDQKARVDQIQKLINELSASLDHTHRFQTAPTGHTTDLPAEATEVKMYDGTVYPLTARSRVKLLEAEQRVRETARTMAQKYPNMTPQAWWQLLRAAGEQQHEADLQLLREREETKRANVGMIDSVQEQQKRQLELLNRKVSEEEGEFDQEDEEESNLDSSNRATSIELAAKRRRRAASITLDGLDEEERATKEEDARRKRLARIRQHQREEDGLEEAEEEDIVQPTAFNGAAFASLANKRQAEVVLANSPEMVAKKREVAVYNVQTMASLADAMGVAVKKLTAKMRELDLSVEQGSQSIVREDTARLLIEEFGFIPVQGSQVVQPQVVASLRRKAMKTEEYLRLPSRPPVITVSGHVDHGKTTLLDRLRSENRAAGEAGGITQAIGAFRVSLAPPPAEGEEHALMQDHDAEGKPTYATFLDTPGHAAFASMRAKGCSSSCTDIIILVISAADGLQPQSLEVIQLARQNNVPIIIAVNKIDVPGADPDAILQQLQVHDVVVESLGGEVLSCNISAKTGQGIQELKELIQLTSEVLQLHADREAPGEAYVIESRIAKRGGGCVANILVRNGALRAGQYFVCGLQYGRIRTLLDENERPMEVVHPGQAAQLTGLKSLDDLTEDLYIVDSEETAMKVIADRQELLTLDESDLVSAQQQQQQADQKAQAFKIQVSRRRKRVAIRPLTEEEQAAAAKSEASVPVMVKADVSGSMEVLLDYFSKLPRDEVLCSIVKSGLGEITVADVEYASEVGSEVAILGFNVKPTSEAVLLAKQKGIRLYHHPVIYSLWDDIRDLLSEKLPAEMEDVEVGQAIVQQLFPLSGGGGKKKAKANAEAQAAAAEGLEAPTSDKAMVAGCRVKSGKIDARMKFKIMRDEEQIFDGECISLRVNRDMKPMVEKGAECGIRLSAGSDALIAVGDVIQCYEKVKRKRTLDDQLARGFVDTAKQGGNIHQQEY